MPHYIERRGVLFPVAECRLVQLNTVSGRALTLPATAELVKTEAIEIVEVYRVKPRRPKADDTELASLPSVENGTSLEMDVNRPALQSAETLSTQ